MEHPINFEKLIADYFEGNLTPDERLQLDEWLNSSEENKNWFDTIAKSANTSDLADLYDLKHPYHWSKMDARVKLIKRRKLIFRVSKIAAAFVLPFALATALYTIVRNTPSEVVVETPVIKPGERKAVLLLSNGEKVNLGKNPSRVNEADGLELSANGIAGLVYSPAIGKSMKLFYNTLDVPVGGEYLIQLSDGTRIWMNSSSKLVYPAIFPKDKREVWLEGEAYFEVAHNPESPFSVKTKYMSTTVLGTRFNVSAYDDDAVASVTLVAGSVRVKPNGVDAQVLRPDYQLNFDKRAKAVSVEKVETDVYTAWKDGVFYFDSETLGSIMRKASRWYNAKIVFESDEARNMVFYGKLKRYENIDKLLNIMKLTNKIDYTIKGNTVVIRKVSE